MGAFDRTVSLIGEDGFERLRHASVLVVGLGGVGGAATEALARSGVGKLTLADGDVFEQSNLNRQILCTTFSLGKNKALVAKERVQSIMPDTEVVAVPHYVTAENVADLLVGIDYCLDAIDDIKNKVLLIRECDRRNIPIISAMGAGNRVDCDFGVIDIFKTKDDPFARKLRAELRKAGITKLDVVCGQSPPIAKANVFSIAPPPMAMGATLAGFVVKKLALL